MEVPVNQIATETILSNKRLVLEELRRVFDKAYATTDVLDQKLQTLLQATGIAIALVGAIQVPKLIGQGSWAFISLFGLALLLFIVMVILLLRAFQANDFHMPISGKWEALRTMYFEQDEESALNQLISDHLDRIQQCVRVSVQKDQYLQAATILFGAIVVALLIMLALGFVA